MLVPFQPASNSAACNVDDTDLLAAQEKAGSSVYKFIKLGKVFEEGKREEITEDSEVKKYWLNLKLKLKVE